MAVLLAVHRPPQFLEHAVRRETHGFAKRRIARQMQQRHKHARIVLPQFLPAIVDGDVREARQLFGLFVKFTLLAAAVVLGRCKKRSPGDAVRETPKVILPDWQLLRSRRELLPLRGALRKRANFYVLDARQEAAGTLGWLLAG
jgi:hypothetical protein